jgi:predicted ATP-dependent endonuclease of OLD family
MAHLRGFGLENFRVFNEETWLDFAPITILTGQNSSGKSSINKAILLLQESFNMGSITNERGMSTIDSIYPFSIINDLLFQGKNHLLGNYNKIVNNKTINKPVSFIFPITLGSIYDQLLIKLTYVQNNRNSLHNGILKSINICLRNSKKSILNVSLLDDKDFYLDFSYFKTKFESYIKSNIERLKEEDEDQKKWDRFYVLDKIENRTKDEQIEYDILKAYCGSTDYSIYERQFDLFKDFHNSEFCILDYNLFKDYDLNSSLFNPKDKFVKMKEYSEEASINLMNEEIEIIEEYLKKYKVNFIENEESVTNDKAYNRYQGSIADFYDDNCQNLQVFSDSLSKAFKDNKFNKKNKNLDLLIQFIEKSFFASLYLIKSNFNSINYIESVRSIVERIYTDQNNITSFNKLLIEFQTNLIQNDEMKSFFTRWLNKFGIADEIIIQRPEEGIGSMIYLKKDNKQYLLADVGYGVSQILPLLMKIIIISSNNLESNFNECETSTLIVEEPETNLHPKLQSLLSDLFIDAAKTFNIQFIIETHSEYLIRKMQYLTAKKEISPTNSVIYYLHSSDNKNKKANRVTKINILEDGSLSDTFGPGFFDEADNLAIDLFNLHSNRKN